MSDPWGPPGASDGWPGQRGTADAPGPGQATSDLRWDGAFAYQPPSVEPPVDLREWVRVTLAPRARTFATAASVMVLLGAPVGLLWTRISPRVPIVRVGDGFDLGSTEGTEFFTQDGRFFLLSVVAGVLGALIAWALLRQRGPAVPVGLAVGGLLAAQVARAVGGLVVVEPALYDFCHAPGRVCNLYDGTLDVRATAVLVVWAVVGLLTFLVLTALFDHPAPALVGQPWWTTAPGQEAVAPGQEAAALSPNGAAPGQEAAALSPNGAAPGQDAADTGAWVRTPEETWTPPNKDR